MPRGIYIRKPKAQEHKERVMQTWIEAELETRGFTRSHDFHDFFRACRSIVSEATVRFKYRPCRTSEMARMMATEIVMDYIDPWN